MNRSQLELRGCHFIMTSFRGNAKPPQILLDVSHEGENSRRNTPKVMVFKLLMLCGRSPEKRPASLKQIWTLQIELFIYKKILLLCAKRHSHMLLRQSKTLHQPHDSLFEGLS